MEGGPVVMKLDLHVHTVKSHDGYVEPKNVIDCAAEKGLDGIAITDHDTMEGYRACVKYAKERGITLIPGIEVPTDRGHVLVLGNDGKPESLKFEDVVRYADEKGVLTIGAHPFTRTRKRTRPRFLRKLDAVEVLNGRTYSPFNRKARRFAEREKMPQTGGSDSHHLEELGTFWTEVEGECIDEILENIKKGECSAKGSPRSLLPLTKTKIKDALSQRLR